MTSIIVTIYGAISAHSMSQNSYSFAIPLYAAINVKTCWFKRP